MGVAGAALAAPRTHTIVIDAMQFSPATLTVQRGDRVVWVNKDLLPHSATAASKAFDSRRIAPQASWGSVMDKPGRLDYLCTFHPTMKGTLVVH